MKKALEVAFNEREKQLKRAQTAATNDMVKAGYQEEIDDLRAAFQEVLALEIHHKNTTPKK